MYIEGSQLSVTVINLGNEIGNTCSNPEQGWVSLNTNAFEKVMNTSLLSSAMSK